MKESMPIYKTFPTYENLRDEVAFLIGKIFKVSACASILRCHKVSIEPRHSNSSAPFICRNIYNDNEPIQLLHTEETIGMFLGFAIANSDPKTLRLLFLQTNKDDVRYIVLLGYETPGQNALEYFFYLTEENLISEEKELKLGGIATETKVCVRWFKGEMQGLKSDPGGDGHASSTMHMFTPHPALWFSWISMVETPNP